MENTKFYINSILANSCMPTLLNIKPSTLVQLRKKYGNKEDLLRNLNNAMKQFSCKYTELYENEEIVSIFIYQDKLLLATLEIPEYQEYLSEMGYQLKNNEFTPLFNQLRLKFDLYHSDKQRCSLERKENNKDCNYESESSNGFPHEIGILLGYPLQDVKDFIRNKGQNSKLSGCWKVYYNTEQAYEIFELYHKIRDEALNDIMEGKALPQRSDYLSNHTIGTRLTEVLF
jgi:hypothetical protein